MNSQACRSIKHTAACILMLSVSLVACKSSNKMAVAKSTDNTTIKFTAKPDSQWTALFNRQHGWFGADGIYAIPLNGKDTKSADDDTTMLVFSDSMIGDIINGKLQPGYVMIHNSVAYVKGTISEKDKIQFKWDSTSIGQPLSVFEPRTPATKEGDYYWLGDGFVNTERNNEINLFGHTIRNTKDSVFGFKEVGTTLITIPAYSRPPFKNLQQIDLPFLNDGDEEQFASFGAGVFVNTKKTGIANGDGFVYVYGVRGKAKHLVAARVKPKDIGNVAEWRYWDGRKWNADMHTIANITDHLSNELSVTRLQDGRYALVFQVDGIGSAVGLRLGSSPVGPFGPVIKIWECPEIKLGKNIFTYNAKAHSNFSTPNELLISYNVNSFDFFNDIQKYPDLYRPRFIRVKVE
ncbi:DUF4185 domain-containing protein [Danxiaibacter flavus]|uniref:DUF4185 domain-containing protein n=1 Tax=Danxiaibacter flavus TaxID=3049108 RepID=A0ABV3ZFN5_9BACT|nr:DUF4185 domain-containing protein [Chitinophagaceae bacterium DXS]